ncbi:MAG: hypothetical protein ACO39X_04075 [Candidatus Nanopelagicaceae bacterium]
MKDIPTTRCFNDITIHTSADHAKAMSYVIDTDQELLQYLAPLPNDADRVEYWGSRGLAHPHHFGSFHTIPAFYLEVDSADTPPLKALETSIDTHDSISRIECSYYNRDTELLGYWSSDSGDTRVPYPKTRKEADAIEEEHPCLSSILFTISMDFL